MWATPHIFRTLAFREHPKRTQDQVCKPLRVSREISSLVCASERISPVQKPSLFKPLGAIETDCVSGVMAAVADNS
jgi:hypothetical protein